MLRINVHRLSMKYTEVSSSVRYYWYYWLLIALVSRVIEAKGKKGASDFLSVFAVRIDTHARLLASVCHLGASGRDYAVHEGMREGERPETLRPRGHLTPKLHLLECHMSQLSCSACTKLKFCF